MSRKFIHTLEKFDRIPGSSDSNIPVPAWLLSDPGFFLQVMVLVAIPYRVSLTSRSYVNVVNA